MLQSQFVLMQTNSELEFEAGSCGMQGDTQVTMLPILDNAIALSSAQVL